MTKRRRAIVPKRRVLFPGSTKRIRAPRFLLAKADGSRSAKAIEPRMRSGKTPDHSEPTTGNMFSETNGQSRISTKAPASMFRLLCAITSDCNQLTSPTGGSWISVKCPAVRGQRMAKTTHSLLTIAQRARRWLNDWARSRAKRNTRSFSQRASVPRKSRRRV